MVSAATERMDDLDLVAVSQYLVGMLTARHDFAVQLYSDSPFRQTFCLQQVHEGGECRKWAWLAIEDDIHHTIVPPVGVGCQWWT